MLKARYDEFIKRIAQEASVTETEVDRKVKEKQVILSGLVSLEGAALIVASELGVKFDKKRVKISELLVGMRNIEVVGKIIRIYPVRTFQQGKGGEGKVMNLFIADDTSSVRVVLWDTNHIALFEEGKLKESDTIVLRDVDVRGVDVKELHLSGKSSIALSDEKLEGVKVGITLSTKKISDLQEGDRIAVRATIVQIFDPNFFAVCPLCNQRLSPLGDKFLCKEHEEVSPNWLPILNSVIDDGFGNVRAVCFSDSILRLLKISEDKLASLKEDFSRFKEELLGEERFFEGRVRKNAAFN
ncbi:MAG: hypothetical protein AABX59_00620, partial [Nanoarchaeota archaeon]